MTKVKRYLTQSRKYYICDEEPLVYLFLTYMEHNSRLLFPFFRNLCILLTAGLFHFQDEVNLPWREADDIKAERPEIFEDDAF
jgi:hypothetical protein